MKNANVKRRLCLAGAAALLCAALFAGPALAQEEIVFAEDGMDLCDAKRYLTFSRGCDLTFELCAGQYTVTDAAGHTAAWGDGPVAADGFQAEMLPRTIEEARRMNRVRVYLSDEALFWQRCVAELNQRKTLPVYAAPSQEAWRGANDKAAVSLLEPFTVLGIPEDEAWWLIEYEVSGGERRIGYIRRPECKLAAGRLGMIPLTLTLVEEASMTDDPHGGCREIARFSAGETVTCLGYMDSLWVYAQTEIDGREARGFLPMRALATHEEEPLPDVMARMSGTWRFAGGAELLGLAGVIVHEDGTLTPCTTDDWSVFPPEKLICDGEPIPFAVFAAPKGRYAGGEYVIELRSENGVPTRYGLELIPGQERENGLMSMGLYMGEGGGFYEKVE